MWLDMTNNFVGVLVALIVLVIVFLNFYLLHGDWSPWKRF